MLPVSVQLSRSHTRLKLRLQALELHFKSPGNQPQDVQISRHRPHLKSDSLPLGLQDWAPALGLRIMLPINKNIKPCRIITSRCDQREAHI